MPNVSTVYATLDQFAQSGVAPDAFREVDDATKLVALQQASTTADMDLSTRYNLPLLQWGDDLTQIVCMIAGYRLLVNRGLTPGQDHPLTVLYKEALQTLRDVACGRKQLNVVDTAPEVVTAPDAWCEPPRDFGSGRSGGWW